nr:hypothetical protein Muribac2_130 [uncultured Muribaculaceae bacterium]
MATMYEMIMDLPLFKGVGKDHVSSFLEKTNISFQNYKGGDVLTEPGDPVSMVKFLISGEVSLIHPLEESPITIEERSGFGKVLGADRLFGIHTFYPYKTVSIGRSSIMEFSKEQYVNLLHSDRIYMLNFFNYLSLRAQRSVDSSSRYCQGTIHQMMARLVCVMTEPGARGVVINGTDDALAGYCSSTPDEIRKWKNSLQASGSADCDSTSIHIHSRSQFLDV